MKKLLLYIPMIFISSIFIQNALSQGLLGLIYGINIKNNILLLSSDFLFVSLVIFNLFGKSEKFLYGYGKYLILRYQKRSVVLKKIITTLFVSICIFVLARIIIYAFLLFFCNKKLFDITAKNIINYIALSILSLLFISLLQTIIELKISSFAGLITAFSYYIISIIMGGYFLDKKQYLPIMFLFSNFNMKNRTDLITQNFTKLYTLYLILCFANIICVFICKRIIKCKDIF